MKYAARLRQHLLARLARDERGAAAVEFALILPFLLLLYLGSLEASSLFTVDRRVEVISSSLADLVARWNPNEGAIPRATLQDYLTASQGIMTPYETNGLAQVLSVLAVDADGDATVRWSCGYNGGTARAPNSSYELGANMSTISTGGYLVASETSYSYLPVLGMVFTQPILLTSENLFLPRFQSEILAPVGGCPA